jgi:hypothetical protein
MGRQGEQHGKDKLSQRHFFSTIASLTQSAAAVGHSDLQGCPPGLVGRADTGAHVGAASPHNTGRCLHRAVAEGSTAPAQVQDPVQKLGGNPLWKLGGKWRGATSGQGAGPRGRPQTAAMTRLAAHPPGVCTPVLEGTRGLLPVVLLVPAGPPWLQEWQVEPAAGSCYSPWHYFAARQ